jgi:N6-adenosine-specific RNA methylase IME4
VTDEITSAEWAEYQRTHHPDGTPKMPGRFLAPDWPTGQYDIIYADPAWAYDDEARAGNRGAACKYDVMTNDELKALPVPRIAADDCALFLWVTMPKLEDAWQVMKAWGFEFKTVAFTWIKYTAPGNTLFWGMGRWTRSNPELCWLCTKGNPKRLSARIHSVIDDRMHSVIDSQIEFHSAKPNEARQRIMDLVGDPTNQNREIRRIELFARRRYVGWDAWGNQVNDFYEDEGRDLWT